MITFREGTQIAKEFGMHYDGGPYYPEEYTHTFDEMRMIKSYWVKHAFDLVESVEQCIEMKIRACAEEEEEDGGTDGLL